MHHWILITKILTGETFFTILTFLAMKSTIRRDRIRQPAAILAVRSFVDASMRTIPQNDEPRSAIRKK